MTPAIYVNICTLTVLIVRDDVSSFFSHAHAALDERVNQKSVLVLFVGAHRSSNECELMDELLVHNG
jgi:hypothetical protein